MPDQSSLSKRLNMTTPYPMADAAIDNSHVRPEFLKFALVDQLERLSNKVGEELELEFLHRQKDGVDTTTKVLARTNSGRPIAVVVCSRPAAPDLVARGLRMAESIRGLVGREFGESIIKPLASGDVDGRSYMILPFYHDFSSFKLLRTAQRLQMHRPLLGWLAGATRAAAQSHRDGAAADRNFTIMLRHVERATVFDEGIRAAARESLRRLESQIWLPRHTFDHNDFWLGNVMRVSRSDPRRQYPFILIDWAGANDMGYGIYDLLRLARSLKLSIHALRRELMLHSDALQCSLEDTRGHFLAAIGRLHQHIEHFPEERLCKLVRYCWAYLNRALSDSR
jgi:hypothetical protein